jgi:hypothetical protein
VISEEEDLHQRSVGTGRRRCALAARGLTTAAALLAWGWAAPASAWGPVAHQAVNTKAIDTLPKGMKDFYKNHRLEMPSLSLEATFPDEGPDRRFAVDRLLAFPFPELPHTEESLKAKYPDAADGIGRLPWLIHDAYGRLVEAFRSGDKAKILAESDTLALLVAEMKNPLTLTDNYDGQKTGQHGLWVRFTTRLPEAMQQKLKVDAEAARFLDNPKDYVFSMVNASYVWVDNLLYEEELARRGKAGYTEIYYEAFALRAGPILRARLGQAAADVGSYWYTAWTAAGRPELK